MAAQSIYFVAGIVQRRMIVVSPKNDPMLRCSLNYIPLFPLSSSPSILQP